MIVELSKGRQITIPSKYRKDLKLHVGSKVELTKKGNAIILKPIEEDLSRLFQEAMKIKPKHRLTASQMDKFVEDEILR